MNVSTRVLVGFATTGIVALGIALIGVMQASAQTGVAPCTGNAGWLNPTPCGADHECEPPQCSNWYEDGPNSVYRCDGSDRLPTSNCGGCGGAPENYLPCGTGGSCGYDKEDNVCTNGAPKGKFIGNCRELGACYIE
jgi:hypothetical protein